MKKNIIVALGLLMTIAFTASAWAGDITITGSDPGGNLVFKASPNTLVSHSTDATAFTLVTASSKTTTENGIEYCMVSIDGYIRQMKQAADGAVTDISGDAAGAIPADFTVKGGAASGS